jgi:hypothetical protein
MRAARSCYDHLAGRLAVDLADALQIQGHLELDRDGGAVTDSGEKLLREFGIDLAPLKRSKRAFGLPVV